MKINLLKKSLVAIGFLGLIQKVKGAGIDSGQTMVFDSLDKLLWSIIVTIQYYTLPIIAIALVLLGVKLLTSGDDTNTKETVKTWIIKILIGGVIIFGAATLATIIKNNVGGTNL